MNSRKKLGIMTTVAGAALAFSGLVGSGTASASPVTNPTFHEGNVTTCAQIGLTGYTQVDGSATTSGATGGLTYTVTTNQYVTITAKADTVGALTVVMKGGDNYNVYSPELANMVSPLNGGGQVPAISHWFACYMPVTPSTTAAPTTEAPTTVPETTPTTAAPTTEAPTTEAPTTVAPTTEAPTTTIEGEAGGPTTTVKSTTTVKGESGGPTTVSSNGGGLPRTGSSQSILVALGLAMILGGLLFIALTRKPEEA